MPPDADERPDIDDDGDEPDEAQEHTAKPAHEPAGHRPAFATRTLVNQPPPGATHDAGATVFNVPGATAPAPAPPTGPQPLMSPGAWTWLVVLGGLTIAMFWHFLQRMAMIALNDADWSHALLVPLISIYFIQQRYDRLKKTPPRIGFWGLPIVFIGLFSYAFWIEPGRNDMFQGYSLILTLLGLTLFTLGPGMLKHLWLPIVYLGFGVKVSNAIWNPLAAKLQLLAAQASTAVLQFFSSFMDLEANRSGTTISLSFMRDGAWITGQELNVAEACSGLRMLAAFMALGVLVAYMTPRTWWQRLTMVLMTVPIALLVNVGRVAILGLLFPINPDMAAGSFHKYVGLVMLIPALLLYLLLGWVLDRIYVYEPLPQPQPDIPAKLPRTRTMIQRFNDATRGIMGGAVLCLLVGATYGALLLTLRPDLAKGDFSQKMGMQLLLGSFAVLAVFAWVVRRMLDAEIKQPRVIGRTVSMGLIAGVLAMSVLGLTAVVKATKVVMIKDPIELRQPLYRIPPQVGTWVRVQDDPALSEEMLDALGTRSYISRIYRDTGAAPGQPGATVKLHVAYYTGTPDTVPHVPERCFVAGGLQAVDEGTTRITLQGDRYIPQGDGYRTRSQVEPHEVYLPDKRIDATVFTFASANDPTAQANVIYFFSANGKFLATPEGVRLKGFDPRDRYSYYCKIEVLLPDVADVTTASSRTSAFLSEVLPEIVACLPKWDDVKAGGESQ
jgi:exosortase